MFDTIIRGGDVVTPQGVVNGDVAISVSGHRNIRIAQHQGFGQHIVAVVLPPRRRRRCPHAEHERPRAEETERPTAAADRV